MTKHFIDSEISDEYTTEEAKSAIESITGEDSVSIKDSNVKITDSHTINSRYDRMKVSSIISNTVDENGEKITNRSISDLSSEWLGHNILYDSHLYRNERTKHVDLNSDLWTNDPITIVGTFILSFLGFL